MLVHFLEIVFQRIVVSQVWHNGEQLLNYVCIYLFAYILMSHNTISYFIYHICSSQKALFGLWTQPLCILLGWQKWWYIIKGNCISLWKQSISLIQFLIIPCHLNMSHAVLYFDDGSPSHCLKKLPQFLMLHIQSGIISKYAVATPSLPLLLTWSVGHVPFLQNDLRRLKQ